MTPEKKQDNGKELLYRLVYRSDKQGVPCSYVHVEERQALFLMKMVRFIQQAKKDRVTVLDICKGLGTKNRVLIQRMADRLAGVLWIDKRDDQGYDYSVVCRGRVDVRKGTYNKNRNLPRTPRFLKAPYTFSRAAL
ncbi:hypothetical protein D1BOALGB6SA_1050 [Olavius sp. associated proteobacterium Delta 1]|nr:hypothetical protein D1BOALGB6SA_1050 [Olavius sp. associated proteobacterium Delta 1]